MTTVVGVKKRAKDGMPVVACGGRASLVAHMHRRPLTSPRAFDRPLRWKVALVALFASLACGACDDETQPAKAAADAASHEAPDAAGPGMPRDAGRTTDAGRLDATLPRSLVDRVSFAHLYAEDGEATFAWYRDKLGLAPDATRTFALADGATVSILDGGAASTTTKEYAKQSVTVGLQVPDFDAAVTRLEDNGVIFISPTEGTPGDHWRYFADPEGNRLEIAAVGPPHGEFHYERIEWVGAYVQDMPAMREWYEQIFGPPSAVAYGFYVVFELNEGAYLELLSGGAEASEAKSPDVQAFVIGLEVEDLDATIATLAERGLSVTPGAAPQTQAELVDPEGNRWILTAP